MRESLTGTAYSGAEDWYLVRYSVLVPGREILQLQVASSGYSVAGLAYWPPEVGTRSVPVIRQSSSVVRFPTRDARPVLRRTTDNAPPARTTGSARITNDG